MNKLYPLKFSPVFKEKIWGGRKIKEVLHINFGNLRNCGEVWVISGVEGNPTIVKNGFLTGNELNELVEIYMGDLVGDDVYEKYGVEFPILIKYIDATDWLSIQVHPNDALAAKRKIGNGKTEMWYILEADKSSELISGFKKKVSCKEYLHYLEEKKITEILNFEKVKKSDVFFIPAGRIHALGPGILVAEIQQTSDTTYRIYDWDRIDAAGLKRELHTNEALDAIDFSIAHNYKTHYEEKNNQTEEIVNCAAFTTNMLSFDKSIEKNFEELDSFVIYLGIEGNCKLIYENIQLDIALGDAVLVPNIIENVKLIPGGNAKLLEVYIK